MSSVYTLFWFDVEDYLTPESDDALKGLLEVFEACGAQGTWKLVGEKARVLEERGRWDVIRLLQRQDVGCHTDTHSQHPVLAEVLAEAGWDDGVEEVIHRERLGYEDVVRIVGPCSTFGQAGGSWAPQLYPFLREAGIPLFMDEAGHIGCDGEPFWYCGVLHVNRMTGHVTRCPFDRGAMPPRHEWRPAPLRPTGQMEAGLATFKRYLEHVLSRPGVETLTGRQVPNLFPDLAQGEAVAVGDLARAVAPVVEEGAVDVVWLGDAALAPSETFALVCDALMAAIVAAAEGADLDGEDLGELETELEGTPYGPVQRLTSAVPTGEMVSTEAFIEAVADARLSARSRGRVPAACWLGSQPGAGRPAGHRRRPAAHPHRRRPRPAGTGPSARRTHPRRGPRAR